VETTPVRPALEVRLLGFTHSHTEGSDKNLVYLPLGEKEVEERLGLQLHDLV
jgi:hypothetical protein